MTTSELDTLICNAENGNVEALIDSCELLQGDYITFRIKNLILGCHTQLLKLNWTLVQKLAPKVLASDPSLKDLFLEVKSSPTVTGIKDLFEQVILKIQKQSPNSDYLQRVSVVFNRFGTLLPTIIYSHFKEYSNHSDVKKLLSGYNSKPSFHTYTLLIKGLLKLSSNLDEEDRGSRYFSNILSKWDNVEQSSDSIALIQRCKKLAASLGRADELQFTQTRYKAEKGDAIAIAGMGILYEQGIGINKDDTMAKMLYMQAMNAGNKDAEVYLNNLNTRLQQQEAQRTERLRIQTQLEIQTKEQELRRHEAEERRRIESERLEEESRHNMEMEKIELQKIEADKERQLREEAEREKQSEEEMVEVKFFYKLRWNGKILDSCNMTCELSISDYQSLLTGGPNAIISFVQGQIGYRRDENVIDASMRKL